MRKKNTKGAGRKGLAQKWTTKTNLTRLEGWARNGLTNKQIAGNIGITEQTLYTWLKKHPDFAEALEKGKEVVDFEVENAMYKSALGHWEEKEIVDSKTGEVVDVLVEFVKPNVSAQIFWLKNRKPHMWREKQEVQHSGQLDSNVNLSNLSEEELRALAESEVDEDETD